MQGQDEELIVLLSQDGKPIGTAPKLASHHQNTPLHLAFSTYIFNNNGELLVTRRANTKKVWPGVWTNSCCGHPAPGENMTNAISRRVQYELGMNVTDLKVIVPDYRYTTPLFSGIIENEICPIYFARSSDVPKPLSIEVTQYKWLSWEKYITLTSQDKLDKWSWWCKDQLQHIIDTDEVTTYISSV